MVSEYDNETKVSSSENLTSFSHYIHNDINEVYYIAKSHIFRYAPKHFSFTNLSIKYPSPHALHLYDPFKLMQLEVVSGPHGDDWHSSISK